MNNFIEIIKTNYIIIAICLVSILICSLTYLNAATVLEGCNKDYQQQFKMYCTTGYTPTPYNASAPIDISKLKLGGG